MARVVYLYRNLTSAVKDKSSPLRRYLDTRFPTIRPLQTEYRTHSGPLLVDGGTASPATVGAAFDYLVRFSLDPRYLPDVAAIAFVNRPDELAVVGDVTAEAHAATSTGAVDLDTLSRACWALALCTEVYRVGMLPTSPLLALLRAGRFSAPSLLALAPSDALRQLDELQTVARDRLYPHLEPAERLALGPTFDGSHLCSADADLICDGTLIDLKTHLGALNKRTDTRSDSLSVTDLYQVVAYALFDTSDTYALTAIGFYAARYGNLRTWPLEQALATMADGAPIDVAAERRTVWRLLGGAPAT